MPPVHEAGLLDADRLQRCTRCLRVLKDCRRRGIDLPLDAGEWQGLPGRPYPEGSLIVVTALSQAVVLDGGGATCE